AGRVVTSGLCPESAKRQQKASKSAQKPVSVTNSLQLERAFRIGTRQIALQRDFFRSLLRLGAQAPPICTTRGEAGAVGVRNVRLTRRILTVSATCGISETKIVCQQIRYSLRSPKRAA